jgi:hypothetical protein
MEEITTVGQEVPMMEITLLLLARPVIMLIVVTEIMLAPMEIIPVVVIMMPEGIPRAASRTLTTFTVDSTSIVDIANGRQTDGRQTRFCFLGLILLVSSQ